MKKSIPNIENAIQICWATGGSLVPENDRKKFFETFLLK